MQHISDEQLIINRKDHVSTVCTSSLYPGDKKVTIGGKEYSVAQGPIAIDGAGNIRANNHLIRGCQHCLVVISLVTSKPLLVIGHQTSCWRCSHALTEMMDNQQVKMHDVQFVEITHAGKYYKNSNHGPAVAEEFACEDAGRLLLFDSESNFRGEDEAIFANPVVSDGDTKGANRLLDRQVDLLGLTKDERGRCVPDLGHLIKCISNGFFKLKSTNTEFSGKKLLHPLRIKCMSSDISRFLRSYKKAIDVIGSVKNLERQKCLENLASVVPHHCGNHSKCKQEFCKYLQLAQARKMSNDVCGTIEDKQAFVDEIEKKYCEISRFKGEIMDLSCEGQDILTKVILSRITIENINSIAEILSSNRCENYFSVLVKYTEGKRINMDASDSWRVLHAFVAGL